ncbi:hypothetical protein F5887DRAFT_973207 [Amanita rubescens]|nr:hypothetical protein F5887DRAFT_973207 [Amanita rubescens]
MLLKYLSNTLGRSLLLYRRLSTRQRLGSVQKNLSNPSPILDPYGLHARNLCLEFLGVNEQLPEELPVAVKGPPNDRISVGFKPLNPTKEKPVGILGAGASGLYTALILESLNIPYKVLEARDDVGGRLFTHHFPNTTGAPYNYFDVGAMRFPKIDNMRRVFHLFEYPALNTGDIQLNAKLREYHTSCKNTLLSYNGVTVRQSDNPGGDIFKASELILDTDSTPYIKAGINAIINDVIEPFARGIMNDLETRNTLIGPGWRNLMKYDKYSIRTYMSVVYKPSDKLDLPPKHLSTDVILGSEENVEWCCIEFVFIYCVCPVSRLIKTVSVSQSGGSNQIAQCMAKYIRPDGLDVTTNHTEHHNFSHVICTIPLPAIKIGLQFKTAWWTTGINKRGKRLDIVGGETCTDRSLKTIVYPSYGDIDEGKTTTLIASYCFGEDAQRLGALINKDMQRLSKLVLKELADIHDMDLDFLRSELIDTFAWSWSDDLHSMGNAFFFVIALRLIDALIKDGLLHFAGDALTPRQAWVEGALDSAWRAVNEMLWLMPDRRHYLSDFYRIWGYNPEWVLAQPEKSVPESSKTPWGIIPSPPAGREIPEPKDNLILQQLGRTHPEYFQ